MRAEIGRTEENIVQVKQEVVPIPADRHQDRIVAAPADLVVRNSVDLDLAVEHGGIIENIDKVRQLLAEVEVQACLDAHGIGQGGKIALGLFGVRLDDLFLHIVGGGGEYAVIEALVVVVARAAVVGDVALLRGPDLEEAVHDLPVTHELAHRLALVDRKPLRIEIEREEGRGDA